MSKCKDRPRFRFLAGLMLVLGALESLARRFPSGAAGFRQAAAVFAVAATMLPAPLAHLDDVIGRVAAVWLGFALVLPVAGLIAGAARKPVAAARLSRVEAVPVARGGRRG